jgi:hypothetical protein
MPVRWGRSKLFYSVGIGGVVVLSGIFDALFRERKLAVVARKLADLCGSLEHGVDRLGRIAVLPPRETKAAGLAARVYGEPRWLYLVAAETFAPVGECLLFWLAFRGREIEWVRSLVVIVIANLASFGVGEIFNDFRWFGSFSHEFHESHELLENGDCYLQWTFE